jgi:SAM-dependent methyltransferase
LSAAPDPPHLRGGARYDETRFADRASRVRFARMERHVLAAVRGSERVLDLGCGTGRLTACLQAATVVGIDRARGMLGQARLRGLMLVRGDVQALPFAAASFDAAVSTDSVFAGLDWERAFGECARVLRGGAPLVVHHPSDAIRSLRPPWRLVPGWATQGSPTTFVAAAQRAGFTLERVRLWRWLRVPPYLVPMPARVASRTWNHGVFVFRRG